MITEAGVVIEVERMCCGHHSSRLGAIRIVSGGPRVVAHYALVKPGLDNLVMELARNGRSFSVEVVDRHVSEAEWNEDEVG